MVDGQNAFDQLIRNNLVTYGSIRKIAAGEADDYTNDCLLIVSKSIIKW